MNIGNKFSEEFRVTVERAWGDIFDRSNYQSLNQKLFKLMVESLARFSHLDFQRLDRIDLSKIEAKMGQNDLSRFSYHRRRYEGLLMSVSKKISPACKAFQLCYFFCVVYLLWVAFLSYRHGFVWLEYRKLCELSSRLGAEQLDSRGLGNVTLRLSQLRLRSQEAKERVIRFGSPFQNLNIMSGIWFVFMVVLTLTSYQIPYWVNRLMTLDLTGTRFILEPKLYLEHYSRLVMSEVNDYIDSSRNFVIICLNISCSFKKRRSNSVVNLQEDAQSHLCNFNNLVSVQEAKFLKPLSPSLTIMNHNISLKHLRSMALSGELIPLNRTLASMEVMLEQTSIYTYVIAISSCIYGFLFIYSVCNAREMSLNKMDIFVLIQLGYLTMVAFFTVILYLTIGCANSVDYIRYIICLNSMVKSCQSENVLKLDALMMNEQVPSQLDLNRYLYQPKLSSTLLQSHQLARPDYFEDLNKRLLLILLQFRVQVRQMKNNHPSLNTLAFCAAFILMFTGALVLGHAPYIEKDLVVICTLSFSFFIVIGDISLLPICYQHSQFLKLCKSLFGLLAHLVHLQEILRDQKRLLTATPEETQTDPPKHTRARAVVLCAEPNQEGEESDEIDELYNLLDMHIVRLVWKELCNTDILMNKFSTISMGLSFTFASFIRYHLLAGFLIIYSIMSNSFSSNADKVSITNTFNFLFVS